MATEEVRPAGSIVAVHPQSGLIRPGASCCCEKSGRRAIWVVATRSGRRRASVEGLPTAKSLSAFSLKSQPDRLLVVLIIFAWVPLTPKGLREHMPHPNCDGCAASRLC